MIHEQRIHFVPRDHLRCVVQNRSRAAPQKLGGELDRLHATELSEFRGRRAHRALRKFRLADRCESESRGKRLPSRIGPRDDRHAISAALEFAPERRHRVQVPAQFRADESEM